MLHNIKNEQADSNRVKKDYKAGKVHVGTCQTERRETLAGAPSAARDNKGYLHTLSSTLDKPG